MEKQQTYQYSSVDIHKYHNGGMTAEEMHEMESAALNDNLLSDAMDGYAKYAFSEKEVSSLKAKIQEFKQPNQNNSKQIFFYLSVAASLFFMLFFGYQYLNQDQKQKQKVLMAQKETNQQGKPQSTASSETLQDVKSKMENSPSIVKEKKAVALSNNNIPTDNFSKDEPTSLASTEVSANNVIEKNDIKIVESPLPPAIVEDEKRNVTAVDLNSDAVQFTATKEETKEEVTSKSTVAVKAIPSAANNEKVVFKKTNVSDLNSNSYPLIGWSEYQNYINNNIRKPFNDRKSIANSGISNKGTVLLAFKINRKGKPHAIRIIKSLSEECDKEAIRLIESGPLWKKADNKEVNYFIPF